MIGRKYVFAVTSRGDRVLIARNRCRCAWAICEQEGEDSAPRAFPRKVSCSLTHSAPGLLHILCTICADDRSGRVLSQAWRYLDTATGQPRSSQLDVPCRRKYRDSFKAKRRSSSVALSGVRMHPHPRRSMSRLVAVCAAYASASSDDALWFRAVRFVSIGGELLPSTVRQCCARFPSRQ